MVISSIEIRCFDKMAKNKGYNFFGVVKLDLISKGYIYIYIYKLILLMEERRFKPN